MSKRLPNPRLVKIHRSYTVDEAAKLCRVHRNTVRQWIKTGLPTCDHQRPVLILGKDLAAFLTKKRIENKCPSKPGELYCLRCRSAQKPASGMADYEPLTGPVGNLVAMCPVCEGLMNRRTRPDQIQGLRAFMEIKILDSRKGSAP